MDFVVSLPRTRKLPDSIWSIVDRMTMSSHFIPVKSTYKAKEYDKMYIDEIVRWHGIPLSLILDRGAQFTSHFWRSFSKRFWVHRGNSVLLFILRRMDKQNVPLITLKT